jgi:hypothetical protein
MFEAAGSPLGLNLALEDKAPVVRTMVEEWGGYWFHQGNMD